jgi:hypothetical protein
MRFRMRRKAPKVDGKTRSPEVVSGNAENKQALPEDEGDTKELPALDQAFADTLAQRLAPNTLDQAAIQPRVEMRIEDHGGTRRMFAYHSDEDGNLYRLADTFGTRSLQFVNSMLRDIGKATEDHGENKGFLPGSPDELAFNAALAVAAAK